MKDRSKIGEVASLLGLNPRTLRYYEQTGIVSPMRDENGYRLFSLNDVGQLRFVLRAKKLGLTLRDIKDLLEHMRAYRCRTVRSSLRERVIDRIAEIEEQVRELAVLKQDLEAFLQSAGWEVDECPSSADTCACV